MVKLCLTEKGDCSIIQMPFSIGETVRDRRGLVTVAAVQAHFLKFGKVADFLNF